MHSSMSKTVFILARSHEGTILPLSSILVYLPPTMPDLSPLDPSNLFE
jgi:hypothetical protein